VAVAVTVVGLTYRRPGQQGRRSAQPAGAEAAARADQHEGAR
jgi:hypothetical protein